VEAVAVPNPAAGPRTWLRLKLGAPAVRLTARVYSPAWVLLTQRKVDGAWPAGWNTLSLDLAEVPNGLCYVSLEASDGARSSPRRPPLRLLRLR
jgi:hypothetical protein